MCILKLINNKYTENFNIVR